MSIVSLWTIGAIASKKASAVSSVNALIASASGAEVRGPVATITLSQSAGGRAGFFGAVVLIWGGFWRGLGPGGEKPAAVARERPARRHLVGIGGAHDQRS